MKCAATLCATSRLRHGSGLANDSVLNFSDRVISLENPLSDKLSISTFARGFVPWLSSSVAFGRHRDWTSKLLHNRSRKLAPIHKDRYFTKMIITFTGWHKTLGGRTWNTSACLQHSTTIPHDERSMCIFWTSLAGLGHKVGSTVTQCPPWISPRSVLREHG